MKGFDFKIIFQYLALFTEIIDNITDLNDALIVDSAPKILI